MLSQQPLAPDVVRRVDAVTVQEHALRLAEARMNGRHGSQSLGRNTRCGAVGIAAANLVFKPSRAEIHAETVGKAHALVGVPRHGGDLDIAIDPARAPDPPRL